MPLGTDNVPSRQDMSPPLEEDPVTGPVEGSPSPPSKNTMHLVRRIFGSSKQSDTTHDANIDIDVDIETLEMRSGAADSPVRMQRWNEPKGNIARLGFSFFSFAIAGMNDAAVGALIPYLEEYYNLNYTLVSLIFLTPFAGYSTAAFINATIHTKFGQRGIALAAPLCHIITYLVICLHPPFPVVVVINILSGFGNGLTDACFSAWVGSMESANSVQGLLHSCYSMGALFAPLIATSMIVRAHLPWYNFYYVMASEPMFPAD